MSVRSAFSAAYRKGRKLPVGRSNENSAYIRLFHFAVYVYCRQPLVAKFRLAVEVNGGDSFHIGYMQGVSEVACGDQPSYIASISSHRRGPDS